MRMLKTGLLIALWASAQPAALAEETARLEFCAFEDITSFPNLHVSGGSKSWVVDTLVSFAVVPGLTVEFRSLDPYYGLEKFSARGNAKLSIFNDGKVYFRSHYPVSTGEPRVGVDQYLASQGQTLVLAFEDEPGAVLAPLAAMTHQIADNNIDLFGIANPEQTTTLVARLEAEQPFRLLLGTQGSLIADTASIQLTGYKAAMAYGAEQFEKMKADAAAGLCL